MPRLVAADLTPLFRERCPAGGSSSSNGSSSSSGSSASVSTSAEALAASARFLAARTAARGPVGYLPPPPPPPPPPASSASGKEPLGAAEAEAARPEARIRHAERAWIEEAQRIAAHLHSLHLFLGAVRRPYLSTRSSRNGSSSAAASRTLPLPGAPVAALAAWAREAPALVDAERAQIDWAVSDALRKAVVRVEGLEEGEAVRQRTTTSSSLFSRLRPSSSFSNRSHPLFSSQLAAHRASIVLSLRAQLKALSSALRALQERHLGAAKAAARLAAGASARLQRSASSAAGMEMDAVPAPSGSLGLAAPSAEQAQLFDSEASALIRVLEADLHAVQAAERRLAEIGELQTTLLQHLGAQMDTTKALGEEAEMHRQGVEMGNVQLEKARRSHRAATKWLAIFLVGSGCGLLFLHWMD